MPLMKGKDTPSSQLPNDDVSLFRDAMRGVRRLTQDTISPERPRRVKSAYVHQNKAKDNHHAEFFFSDTYFAHFSDPERPSYLQEGVSNQLLKQLRKGHFEPEWFLDLHGMTQQQAKQELSALLAHAKRQHVQCISVMHGIGKRILKQQLPHWLAQHPQVLAFHQAPRNWGGHAAILVLLATDDHNSDGPV